MNTILALDRLLLEIDKVIQKFTKYLSKENTNTKMLLIGIIGKKKNWLNFWTVNFNYFGFCSAFLCSWSVEIKSQVVIGVSNATTQPRTCLFPCPYIYLPICAGPSSGCGEFMDFPNNCAMLMYNCQKSVRKLIYISDISNHN